MEISFGTHSLPVILVLLLTLIPVGKKHKPYLAIILGIGLGILYIPYSELQWTVVNIVDHAIHGLMLGASATGLYEIQKQLKKRGGKG